MRNESCGQCVPCRVGTVRQQEALARLLSGRTRGSVQDELALIAEIGEAMRDASICGLGQTASSAIESAIGKLGGVRMTQRMVSLTIDDQPRGGARGLDDHGGVRAARHRHADALLRRDAAARQRLPRLRRRARGGARAGAGLRAPGRARHGREDRLRARPPQPQDGDGVPRVVDRPVDHAGRRGLPGALRRPARALRAAGAAGPGPRQPAHRATTRSRTARPRPPCTPRSRSTTTSTCATTPSASSVTSASTPAASSGRTRSPSPSRAAASTRGSRPSSRTRCRSRRACTAATASRSARRAR